MIIINMLGVLERFSVLFFFFCSITFRCVIFTHTRIGTHTVCNYLGRWPKFMLEPTIFDWIIDQTETHKNAILLMIFTSREEKKKVGISYEWMLISSMAINKFIGYLIFWNTKIMIIKRDTAFYCFPSNRSNGKLKHWTWWKQSREKKHNNKREKKQQDNQLVA